MVPRVGTSSALRSRSMNLRRRASAASALALACEALRRGRSHTVVSWLTLSAQERRRLERAAGQGRAQSLNIRLS